MQWTDQGHIISVRKHGETSAIIDVLTENHGRHAGLVRGGAGRRLRPVLQIGNKVSVDWRARLSDHLGYYGIEAINARAAELMTDRLSLIGLNAACAVAREALPEREVHKDVYDGFDILMARLHDKDIWPALYVKWEAGLLASMGYGLDLSCCAATGVSNNLTHVSPRSGRAVSEAAAEPYIDKLFALPTFLKQEANVDSQDITDGLALTGYFLETRLQWGVNKTLPEERSRMIERLRVAGVCR